VLIERLLKQLVERERRLWPEVTIKLTVHGPVQMVAADEEYLAQIMRNLLSNAARYSAAGSEIRITAHVVDAWVEVNVTDHGTGVAPEDRERIFEKFYRGRYGVTLAVRGTGLGLAVARQLVEAHAGTIGVRSTVGEGSEFWLRLPIERDPTQTLVA